MRFWLRKVSRVRWKSCRSNTRTHTIVLTSNIRLWQEKTLSWLKSALKFGSIVNFIVGLNRSEVVTVRNKTTTVGINSFWKLILCLEILVRESNTPDRLSDRNKYIIMYLWSCHGQGIRKEIVYRFYDNSSCASLMVIPPSTLQASNTSLSLVVQCIFVKFLS